MTIFGTVTQAGELDAHRHGDELSRAGGQPDRQHGHVEAFDRCLHAALYDHVAGRGEGIHCQGRACTRGLAARRVAGLALVRPTTVRFAWQLCTAKRCTTIARATHTYLRIRPGWGGRQVRFVAIATKGKTTVTSRSTKIVVRGHGAALRAVKMSVLKGVPAPGVAARRVAGLDRSSDHGSLRLAALHCEAMHHDRSSNPHLPAHPTRLGWGRQVRFVAIATKGKTTVTSRSTKVTVGKS